MNCEDVNSPHLREKGSTLTWGWWCLAGGWVFIKGTTTTTWIHRAVLAPSVPYILDGGASVSLLAPDFEWRHQQDDELSVLHADGHHVSLRTVADGVGRVAQVHLVQHFLFTHKASQHHHQLWRSLLKCRVNTTDLLRDVPQTDRSILGRRQKHVSGRMCAQTPDGSIHVSVH